MTDNGRPCPTFNGCALILMLLVLAYVGLSWLLWWAFR